MANMSSSSVASFGLPLTLLAGGFISGYVFGKASAYRNRNPEEADERRRLHFGVYDFPITKGIRHTYGWFRNARGYLQFEQQYLPAEGTAMVGVICVVHGYSDHTTSFLRDISCKFCMRGFAVITLDAVGHGYSDGLHCAISDLKLISGDCSDFLIDRMKKDIFKGLPLFVYGESMGGAVSFNLCTCHPSKDIIKGAILAFPMVKIADEMRPPEFVISLLRWLARYYPFAPITPVPSVDHLALKRKDILQLSLRNQLIYHAKPRLQSAIAMNDATEDINSRMEQLEHPVLIVHGEADVVTDPAVSKTLFSRSASKDKTLKLYPDCWHGLTRAEPEEVMQGVFEDLASWLSQRV